MENKINPKVSWTHNAFACKGSSMKVIDLYSVLRYCQEKISPDSAKQSSGSISAYKSETFNPSHDVIMFDGIVFVDIDYLKDISPDASRIIFESFDKLCGCLPNLLAMNYSYSKNLHLYFYDEDIISDPSLYKSRGSLYLAATAAAIRKVCDIDLRQYERTLDLSNTSPYQKFYLCNSDFQWNVYCVKSTLSNATIKRLKSEYYELFKKAEGYRTIVNTTPVSGTGDIMVDKNYNLLGYGSGYDARTYIVAAAYFHYHEDIELAREWISKQFKNAKEMCVQMDNMVINQTIASKYRKDVDEFLFGRTIGDVYRLDQNQYISDVIDINDLDGKYFYICSNTGTGKTEFVKNFIKKTSNNAIIIQITKALRDGKSRGIEDITYGNWDTIVDRSKIHTTIEGAIRNCNGMNLSEYTVIVDESHLLEEYINVRKSITIELLTLLETAGKVIFMSATPKSDINLFDFKKITFEKIQPQDLVVYQHPMQFSGKGSKEASEYEYMINYIKKTIRETGGEKFIIFSNKKQESWKKYGLENEDVTFFNSNNITDPNVQSILKYNRLNSDITLSTKYMGCGVEVKKEREVHIVFNLNEGFDLDFIIQSIGRPRASGGVEKIILHLFYTIDRRWVATVGEEILNDIDSAFQNLIIEAEEYDIINILAAKMLNIYDPHFNQYSVKEKIKGLWVGNYVNERIYHTPYAFELFKKLPYQKIDVINLPTQIINMDGKVRRVRKEDELVDYLCSLKSFEITNMGVESGYEEILKGNTIPYNDPVNARKVIQSAKFVVKYIELPEAIKFFGDIKKAYDTLAMLVRYAKVNAGVYGVKEFNGSTAMKAKLDLEFEKVKKVFTDDFIQTIVEDVAGWKVKTEDLNIFDDDVFSMLIDEYDNKYKGSHTTSKFNGDSYSSCVNNKNMKDVSGRVGGKMGSPKKSIVIKRLSDGEEFSFDSKGECMEWLGWSPPKFSYFIKNQVDKKKQYVVVEVENNKNAQ